MSAVIGVSELLVICSRRCSDCRAVDDEFGTERCVFMGASKPTNIEGMQLMSVSDDLANAMPAAWFEIAARTL